MTEAEIAPTRPAPESGPWSIADALVELWKDVLQLEQVVLEDDFFELGGDSLAAADLVFRASERFGIEPSLTSFIAEPTVAAMARAIQSENVAPRDAARALVPLRSNGTRAPLFLVHGTSFSVDHYRLLVRHLRADIPVYGVQEDLFRTPPYLPPDLPALARHYVDVIRTRWPTGPYRLAGVSSAGVIVAEMARTLRRSGAEVERAILIDAYPLWLWGTRSWVAFRARYLAFIAFRQKAAWASRVPSHSASQGGPTRCSRWIGDASGGQSDRPPATASSIPSSQPCRRAAHAPRHGRGTGVVARSTSEMEQRCLGHRDGRRARHASRRHQRAYVAEVAARMGDRL